MECVSHACAVRKQNSHDNGAFSVDVYAIDGDAPRYTTGLTRLAEILVPGPFKPSDAVASKVLYIHMWRVLDTPYGSLFLILFISLHA